MSPLTALQQQLTAQVQQLQSAVTNEVNAVIKAETALLKQLGSKSEELTVKDILGDHFVTPKETSTKDMAVDLVFMSMGSHKSGMMHM
jgi:hypothetical protein